MDYTRPWRMTILATINQLAKQSLSVHGVRSEVHCTGVQ